MDALKPVERLRFIIDLAGDVIPKMKAVEVKAEVTSQNSDMIQRLLNIPDKEFEKEFNNE